MLTNMSEKRRYERRPPGEELPAVAKNIKRFRELAGMTQEQLANEAGLSTVALLETGRRRYARDETLEALAQVFSAHLGYRVTTDDLRTEASTVVPEEIEQSLQEFIASDYAEGGVGDDEVNELRRAPWIWGPPSKKRWSMMLEILRSTRTERRPK